MSLIASEDPFRLQSGAKGPARPDHDDAPPDHARRSEPAGAPPPISAMENFLGALHMVIRIPGRPPLRLETDRVRAKPAVSPNLSFMIGQTAIGLGLWGLFFPRAVKRTLGVRASAPVVAALFGQRELWSGARLFVDPTRTDVLWARVAADVADLGVLCALARPDNPKRGNARLALGLVAAITALDAIVRVTSTCICGSDLHLFDGLVPTMCAGDVMGHGPMGEVVEVGPEAKAKGLKVGDRVVVPFQTTCGECEQCLKQNSSLCQTSNRNANLAQTFWGDTCAGLFGYSHITGGYAGGQAEYLRVPFAATTLVKVPTTGPDERWLFLSDIVPTGWQAAKQADIQPTDTVGVWGCGPVGLFTIKSALVQGARRVIAIDEVDERLAKARSIGAETLDRREAHNVLDAAREMTGGHGPDKTIDAVGMEAHGPTKLLSLVDKIQTALKLETERPIALREAIQACKGGAWCRCPASMAGCPT